MDGRQHLFDERAPEEDDFGEGLGKIDHRCDLGFRQKPAADESVTQGKFEGIDERHLRRTRVHDPHRFEEGRGKDQRIVVHHGQTAVLAVAQIADVLQLGLRRSLDKNILPDSPFDLLWRAGGKGIDVFIEHAGIDETEGQAAFAGAHGMQHPQQDIGVGRDL